MQGAAGRTETVRRLQGRMVSWLRGPGVHPAGRQSMCRKAAGPREELDVRVTRGSKRAGVTLWDDAVWHGACGVDMTLTTAFLKQVHWQTPCC
jgi:hypothetical protein